MALSLPRRPLIIAGALLFLGFASLRFAQRQLGRHLFNATTWRAHPARVPEFDGTRQHLVRHLLRGGWLTGLTRDSVVALLGPSDTTEYFRDWHLVYWLGPERSLVGVDSEWLAIRFKANGQVGKAQLVTD